MIQLVYLRHIDLKADELYRSKPNSFEYTKISIPLTVLYPFPHNSIQLNAEI